MSPAQLIPIATDSNTPLGGTHVILAIITGIVSSHRGTSDALIASPNTHTFTGCKSGCD